MVGDDEAAHKALPTAMIQDIKGKARKRSYRGTRKGPPARPEKAVEDPRAATRSQVPGVVCYAIRQGLLHKRGAYGGRRA